jgi:hypothetical protein
MGWPGCSGTSWNVKAKACNQEITFKFHEG